MFSHGIANWLLRSVMPVLTRLSRFRLDVADRRRFIPTSLVYEPNQFPRLVLAGAVVALIRISSTCANELDPVV